MNPQATIIYNILLDGQWHCPIEWGYADGHCKRITDINRAVQKDGLKVESKVCDCGRHDSKILKRRLTKMEQKISTCCYSQMVFGVCAKDCKKVKEGMLI